MKVMPGGVELAPGPGLALADLPQSRVGVSSCLLDSGRSLSGRRRAFQDDQPDRPHQGIEGIAQPRAQLVDPRELLGRVSDLNVNIAQAVVELTGDVGLLQEVKVSLAAGLASPAAMVRQR